MLRRPSKSLKRRLAVGTFLVAVAFLVLVAASVGCGHTIHGPHTRDGEPFDFRSSPLACTIPDSVSPGPDEVAIRYLGVSGTYIEWREQAVMTAPFFSNPGLTRVLLGRFTPRSDRIADAFERTEVPLPLIGAILVGHAHYDHLGDVPSIARKHTERARIYVNATGVASLAAEKRLENRVTTVEPSAEWLRLRDAAGNRLPFRVLPVRSLHAPHVGCYTWASGERRNRADRPLGDQPIRRMRAGTTLAYVIDLLDEQAETRFRIYFQDSVNDGDWGYPPDLGDDHGFDLAILVMASYHLVTGAPSRTIKALNPRHIMVTHFESFFRDPARPTVFVPGLTNGSANHYLDLARAAASNKSHHAAPRNHPCGPSSSAHTMPVVGDWLVFSTAAAE